MSRDYVKIAHESVTRSDVVTNAWMNILGFFQQTISTLLNPILWCQPIAALLAHSATADDVLTQRQKSSFLPFPDSSPNSTIFPSS